MAVKRPDPLADYHLIFYECMHTHTPHNNEFISLNHYHNSQTQIKCIIKIIDLLVSLE